MFKAGYYCEIKRIRWVLKMARIGETGNAHRIMMRKPLGKRPLRRQIREDNVRDQDCKNWK
jgi:hypothetical protein